MPNNVVHTKRDEHLWEKATEIAEEAGKKDNYAYVMGIYKKMNPSHEFKTAYDEVGRQPGKPWEHGTVEPIRHVPGEGSHTPPARNGWGESTPETKRVPMSIPGFGSTRAATIRLAYARPELRPHLLPLLRVANVHLSRGETREFARSRLRVHRYNDALQVTDLTNAGKRGKGVYVLSVNYYQSGVADEAVFEMLGLDALDVTPFNDVVTLVEENVPRLQAQGIYVSSDVSHKRGVDVAPAGFENIEVHGDYVYAKAENDSFTVQDKVDQNNLPTCYARGKRDVYAFYRWLAEPKNRALVQKGKFAQVLEGMTAAGIDYKYYCAMD